MVYIERFNPENECWPLALDFTIHFISGNIPEYSVVKEINTMSSTIELLKKYNLKFILSIPTFSLLSPFIWYIIIKNHKYITFNSRFQNCKKRLISQGSKYATFYHLTGKQLYNIRGERWTHCVVGYWNLSEFHLFDPFLEVLKKESPQIDPVLKESNLDKTFSLKLLIWN